MTKTGMFLTACCLLLAVTARAADMVLEVIPLKHRLSDDVVHIIQPLVTPGGTVTGMNNQLIVKTTPANLEEIKQVLNSLDQAPRRLRTSMPCRRRPSP